MLRIGAEVEIEGVVRTPDAVAIAGRFKGLVDGETVSIEGQAVVEGTLVADTIAIEGMFTGDVYARRLRLGDTATVHGRIFHSELDLAAGAYFEGQSRRIADPRALYTTHKDQPPDEGAG